MSEDTLSVVVPTNIEIASLIGLSHSGVSRIRSGQRLPSLQAMRRIEQEFGWSLNSQAIAREQGTYAVEFEVAVTTNREPTTTR